MPPEPEGHLGAPPRSAWRGDLRLPKGRVRTFAGAACLPAVELVTVGGENARPPSTRHTPHSESRLQQRWLTPAPGRRGRRQLPHLPREGAQMRMPVRGSDPQDSRRAADRGRTGVQGPPPGTAGVWGTGAWTVRALVSRPRRQHFAHEESPFWSACLAPSRRPSRLGGM